MSALDRINYYRRIFRAYFLPGASQLTFWHETPQVNSRVIIASLGEYYMPFSEKAEYAGSHDKQGIPMLNYHGKIGLQYNPIAIAQWGLGNFNLFKRTQEPTYKTKFVAASDWLCDHLVQNSSGIWVWQHHFDWEYRSKLEAPWHSGLAQGQGISLLVRAHAETGDVRYREAADRAFQSFLKPITEGGITFTDERGDLWFEEYIVSPPTHILNGFIWAAWAVYDYFLATGDELAQRFFRNSIETLRNNLHCYDAGFWSLYEDSGTRLPMLASPFYHQLHIVQLHVLHRITGEDIFQQYADKWERYAKSPSKRTRALCYKSAFKLCYY
ncbi:MAG TPA: D-glucuronyl C5-epimerase family protein [Terriglobales bacterium]|nr:D-glucuronyl C5-epimerase family protein [Terriglobales bacterium]